MVKMTDNITADAITSAKRPNPWIEFQARVKEITQLYDARGLSSYLRSKKVYAEWSDAEIVRVGLQWVRDESLFDACWSGDLATVKKLVAGGANIAACDKDGDGLIYYALCGGDHVELVEWLLNNGVAYDMNSLLAWASVGGRPNVGALTLNRGGDINTRTPSGHTLLLLACNKGHIDFVRFLISKGVDVNVVCSSGITALHNVVARTDTEIAKLLLINKANVSKRDTTGATPLDKAIRAFNLMKTSNQSTRPAKEMIDLLRSAGAIAAKETMPDELTENIVSPLTHTATVNKAQADAEKAKIEETRVRAEEAAKVTEAAATIVSVEARIVELKRQLAEEETLLLAAKETAEKVRASAEVAVASAAAQTAATATAVESALSSLSLDSDNSINHVTDEVSDKGPIYERRKKIPKRIRTLVWNKYVGEDTPRAKCFCCRDTTISFSAFDCGHVIAESKGGDLTINNLRPVCHDCNLAMGTRSMNDFTTEFFGWSV